MYSTKETYEQAEKLDSHFNALLKKYPLTAATARYWLLFARTVQTGLSIIEAQALKELGLPPA